MIATLERASVSSPIGTIEVTGSSSAVHSVRFLDEEAAIDSVDVMTLSPPLRSFIEQLHEYFVGEREAFDAIPLALDAGDFDVSVWRGLLDLQSGQRMTYGGLAAKIGRRGAARAVGGAVGRNPFAVIVPCHRIVPSSAVESDASTWGKYASGAWRKKWLLEHETRHLRFA